MAQICRQLRALWHPARQQCSKVAGDSLAASGLAPGLHQQPVRRCTGEAAGKAKPNPDAKGPGAKQEFDYSHLTAQHAVPPGDWRFYGIAGAALAGAAAVFFSSRKGSEGLPDAVEVVEHHLVNWSGTHEAQPKRYYQPETEEEVEAVVKSAHEKGEKLRCVGSALSPNGLAFSSEGMLSLALLDRVLDIDEKTQQVTVQAGARVQEVVEALRPHGLTLQNFASIREQAIGGFVQVGAHGTGARIPPVDEQVVSMKLVTPALGTLELSRESNPSLFYLARVGLGALGVVTQVTLQCIPAHKLLEHTCVMDAKQIERDHARMLRENQHLRYMWIPYTDSVVVVTNNPLKQGWWAWLRGQDRAPKSKEQDTDTRLQALRDLLLLANPTFDLDELQHLSATQLRDQLLAVDPLNTQWVMQINRAEADFWRKSEGYRVGWSDELLGFDCGGQQWVLETCFPTGSLKNPSGADLAYVRDLLGDIEAYSIPAPAPIEQRWTAASRSDMSPAHSHNPPDPVFSWVGIIMYLPTELPEQRRLITESFRNYVKLCEEDVMPRHRAVEHWAKIEAVHLIPEDQDRIRMRIAQRYPVAKYNLARQRLDPKNILSNHIIDLLFPLDDSLKITA